MGIKNWFKKEKTKDESLSLKEILENDELRWIFSSILNNKLTVNPEEWADLAEVVFSDINKIDIEIAKKFQESGLGEKVLEIKESKDRFLNLFRTVEVENETVSGSEEEQEQELSSYPELVAELHNIEIERRKQALIKIARESNFGAKALLDTLGEHGLVEYFSDEENCLAVAVNNPKVLDKICDNVVALSEIKKDEEKRESCFRDMIAYLGKLAVHQTSESILASIRGLRLFSGAFTDWLGNKGLAILDAHADKNRAKELVTEEEAAEYARLKKNADQKKAEEKRVEEYEKSQQTEAFGEDDLFVVPETITSQTDNSVSLGSWFIKHVEGVVEFLKQKTKDKKEGEGLVEEDENLRSQAKEFASGKRAKFLEELKQSSSKSRAENSVWENASLDDLKDFNSEIGVKLRSIWKENFKDFFKSEAMARLGEDLKNIPGNVKRKAKYAQARTALSAAIVEFDGLKGKFALKDKKNNGIDPLSTVSFKKVVEEKREIENRLFISFGKEKVNGKEVVQSSAVDQAIKLIEADEGKGGRSDWLEFLSKPEMYRVKQVIDELRKHSKDKFLSNSYILNIFKNTGKLINLKDLGISDAALQLTRKQVEDRLLDYLRKKNLQRWSDHCLTRCGVAPGGKGDAFRSLSVEIMRKKIEDKLKPHIDKLVY